MWTNKPSHRPWIALGAVVTFLAACGDRPEHDDAVATTPGAPPLEVPVVDDNVRHDTLLVQVTFDLGDGTYVMVASHREETFEGLRLYHYIARPDSSAEVLHVSAPAYDSWTMLPTFFGLGRSTTDTMPMDRWILANFGERESWGQKVMLLQNGFQDRGFMHAALPERVVEEGRSSMKCANIAPHMRFATSADTAIFTFACDSVFLYDDHQGRTDIILPARTLRYTFHPHDGLVLWVDGRPRPAQDRS